MEACENAVENIPAQILPARDDGRFIRRKEADDRLGDKLDDRRDDNAEACREQDGIKKRLSGAFRLSGSDVLRAERRDGREHRRRHEEQEADHLFHNADRCRIREPALVRDDGDDDERNLNEPVLAGDGKTDFQNITRNSLVRP